MNKQTVAVLDFGSQYTQLIARRIREQNVYSEILPHTISADDIRKKNIPAVILSGGPSSVYALRNSPRTPKWSKMTIFEGKMKEKL